MTDSGWKQINDIKVNDKICFGLNKEVYPESNYQQGIEHIKGCRVERDENISWLIGAIQGDGTFSQNSVQYMSVEDGLLDKALNIVDEYNLHGPTWTKKVYSSGNNGLRTVNCGASKSKELFRSIGICSSGDKDIKVLRVPECIKRSPLKVIGSYLQGLFDTDGTVQIS